MAELNRITCFVCKQDMLPSFIVYSPAGDVCAVCRAYRGARCADCGEWFHDDPGVWQCHSCRMAEVID